MATMKAKLPDELVAKLTRLGNKTDEVCEKALKAGAEIVEEAVASNLAAVIGSGTKYDSRSTGELQEALGVTPVKLNKNGEYNIKIGFDEPRSDGKSNAMLANVIEFGKHGQPPKPFLKPAKNKSAKAATAKMAEVLESEMDKA
jgi:HK97 gp10 family phage protein